MRLAASRKLIVSEWPPVVYKLYPRSDSRIQNEKNEGNLPATGSHAGTICMRPTWVQFERDWPPDAHYFSTFWQIGKLFNNISHLSTPRTYEILKDKVRIHAKHMAMSERLSFEALRI